MIGQPGSTLWLLRHEMRLAWRNLVGGKRGTRRLIAFAVLGVMVGVGGVTLAVVLAGTEVPVGPVTMVFADVASVMVFTLMLSQILAAGIEALYTRGDLDLLFSSPLAPRKTLTVRFLSLAASAFSTFAVLVLPFLIPAAFFGHWKWLSLFVVLAALALTASAVGLAMAVGLFALIGPRRTRTVAQVLAALIGAAFFLASQTANMMGGRTSRSVYARVVDMATDPRLHLPPIAGWPLRAMLGDPIPLAAFAVVSLALFFGVSAWLSRRFAANAASAQGVDVGLARPPTKAVAAFTGGVFAATFVKELRLLWRDAALLAQVLLRVLYLLPAAFVLVRNAGAHSDWLLPGGAAALCFLAGQVASSLTWVTVSAEDQPDLLAAAPAPMKTVRRAKLAAGLTPLLVILAGPLLALIALAPAAGLAASLGAAASAGASGLLNVWHQRPGKRSEFRSRRSGSWLLGWAQLIITALIGAATGLAAALQIWAVFPAVLAGVALLVMRRSDAQIADTLAAQA